MILKYQQGGVFTPPFVVYQPSAPVTTTTTETTSKKETKKDLGIDLKDVLGLIKDLGGLDGDEIAASEALNQLFTSIEYKLNNPELAELGGFGGTGSIASEYLKIVRLVDNIKRQASEFTKARDTAITNNNLSEAAVDSRGRVMVVGQDGFEWITPEKYYEERENKGYSLVTNAELLDYRAKGLGGLAFNMQAIHTVANGMGSKQITDLINNALTSLGKMSDNTELTGYVGVTAGDLILGIKKYEEALKKSGRYNASVQDLYNVKLLTESQSQLAALALEYIYNTLPNSAKAQLKLKSDGTDKGARTLIGELVTSKTTTKIDFNPSLVGGPTSKHTDTKEQKTSIEDSFLWRVQQNIGTHYGSMKVNNESASALTLKGTIFEQVLTPDNKHIGDNSIENMLNNSHLRSITIGKAYFGNQVLSEDDMKKIMYKGDGLMRTNLPVDDDGKPAFELLDLWESLKLDIDLTKTPTKDLLATDKYKKLRQYFNNDGSWNKNKVKPFIVFNGMTTDGLINIEPKNKFVVDKDTSADMVGRLKLGLATKVGSDMIYPDIDEQNWYEPFDIQYDHVYEGTIYMPIHMNKNSSILNQGVDLGIAYSIEEEYQDSLKPDYQATNINMLK